MIAIRSGKTPASATMDGPDRPGHDDQEGGLVGHQWLWVRSGRPRMRLEMMFDWISWLPP